MYRRDVFDPEHLNIAFHELQPELLLLNIRRQSVLPKNNPYMEADSGYWSEQAYRHYAMANLRLNRTDDEARYMARHFSQRMNPDDCALNDHDDASVFEVLRRYSETLLTTDGRQPLCRYERVLRWRKMTHKLSQDLFTTAYLASEDIRLNRSRTDFVWPSNIDTDNKRLTQMLSQGVSENHFHLTGSTRLFTLSWVGLMNHPDQIHRFFQISRGQFHERLNLSIAGNPSEQLMSWDKLLLYAAFLRAKLFQRCHTPGSIDLSREFYEFDTQLKKQIHIPLDIIESLRYLYGIRMPQKDGTKKVLDYTITNDLEQVLTSPNRLLAGERHLMYSCFRNIYDRTFRSTETDCFYLYLLIKNTFRSELIQVNERIGFENFARYQGRKSMFWDTFPEYNAEAIRLSVNATLCKGHIRSLEARISPDNTPQAIEGWIRENDSSYGFAEIESTAGQMPFDTIAKGPLFYVLHFPKNTREITAYNGSNLSKLCASAYARNSVVRRDIEIQSRAIAKALANSSYLRKRIRGIDACANEIGCRPETFATEFRFLRSNIPCSSHSFQSESDSTVQLSATYHAGEDFIDILDGLRAIDEASIFLKLERGDRLGHAMALGIDPFHYYALKDWRLVIPRQDLLDNLVWLLYRVPELGVDLPPDMEKTLERYATELMDDIGYDIRNHSLLDYFHSWWLRGDHPSLYQNIHPCSNKYLVKCHNQSQCTSCEHRESGNSSNFLFKLRGGYESFHQLDKGLANMYRYNQRARELCRDYHFDPQIKAKGKIINTFVIDRRLASLVEQLQNRLQHCLMEQGICIECNPSSNVLIGPFEQYCDHPMFRFNRHGIHVPRWDHEPAANLNVSINTDDQGVFDTNLENEYACIALSMERQVDRDGNRLNSNDEIYDYLDHIRVLGNSQTFHHRGEELFFGRSREYHEFRNKLVRDSAPADEKERVIWKISSKT